MPNKTTIYINYFLQNPFGGWGASKGFSLLSLTQNTVNNKKKSKTIKNKLSYILFCSLIYLVIKIFI
ncbi:hypothetical protein FB1_05540 [Flavobacterium branchiophilum NBRC 15030 = ATCC 35035]|uniref:Uncharacterized protein n=1 Tax=Flavobacterium branchiophilum TaxID=55197 RepID=A0A543G804_9FLAO|nr:hypothetical protein BC670_3254 [Flavobacterium branchiophilum]GEM54333.1 hypothetical protein FB1_05540 [Flavobacterium branchiophilum NBRC 15030 = ATCC 35035]